MTARAADRSVRASVAVAAPIDRAFHVFTEDIGSWWDPKQHLLEAELAEMVFEPRVGGSVYDRGVDGSECRWARVLAYEPPRRFVISWDVSPRWQLETDYERSSEVEVRFTKKGPDRTLVELEHRNLERHGDGWERIRDAVASPRGWPAGVRAFAERLETGGKRTPTPQPPRRSAPYAYDFPMDTSADLYLGLLKGCLTRSLFLDEEPNVDPKARTEGRDWPKSAETMIGHRRLDNIQHCVTSVLADKVPGDLIEAGVWRGGAAIFMRAVLAAHGVSDRSVWLADSFEGLPAPNPEVYPGDKGLDFTRYPQLAVGVEQVKANFARYGLLDEKVRFLVGWFKDTLPVAPIEKIAVARLDGDLYESTIDAIAALYPKLSVGGYLIVDDYNHPDLSSACQRAINDYRAAHGITEPIQEIDWVGVYWQRER